VIESLRQNTELWELYSLKDEYSKTIYDKIYHGQDSRCDIYDPVVSKYLMDIGQDIVYPDGKSFAVCLTHDVDDLYPPLSHTLLSSAYSIKDREYRSLNNWLFWKGKGKQQSPYWNFRDIMKLESSFGAKSSFYFMATDKDVQRFRYHIEDLSGELGTIADAGWEVGLHGGYYSHDKLDEIMAEKKRLEQTLGKPVIGYRNHYLRFKIPESWELLARAGFKYDSTIGYGNVAGFRNGMCHPYKPFNLRTGAEVDIVEIPLVIMDGALFTQAKTFREAFDIAKKLVDTTKKHKGVLTMLWHNMAFSSPFRSDWARLYAAMLGYCGESGAWMTTGADVLRWWEKQAIV
jgi:peptidoglycan/xylan/chitin deacetylase (PgdA/CDA1 family)